jgi:hypothetical protein
VTCKHDLIQTFRTDDGEPVLWACFECSHKFEPLNIAIYDNYASAVDALQHYAAMPGAIGWPAKNTLTQIGEPAEP